MGRIFTLPPSNRAAFAIASILAVAAGQGWAQQETGAGPVKANAGTVPVRGASAGVGKASKQIQVTCDNPEVRLAFSTFADTVDRGLQDLIGDRTEWVYPIGITVKGSLTDLEQGPATAHRIDLLPNNQFSLKLGIRLSSTFRRDEAARELLRLLLYERMLRPYQANPGAIAGKKIDTPPWLLHGIQELIGHHRSGRPSSFYAGIVHSRQFLTVREIFQGDPEKMDSLSAAVYRASSAALVGALLDQKPKGRENFQEFLADLAGADAEAIAPLLRQHFPGLRGSAGALEKWWSLQIAYMGQKQAFEFLSPEETERLLDEALMVRFGVEPEEDPKGVVGKFLPRVRPGQPFEGRIHDFEKFSGRRDAEGVLTENRIRLRGLSMRCFPLYRNIVARYEAVVVRLLQDRKLGIRAELEAVDQARTGVGVTMARVDDYMNYYEATRAEGRSEAYENYRQARRKIEQRRRPERKDRISKYLDALEVEFGKAGAP